MWHMVCEEWGDFSYTGVKTLLHMKADHTVVMWLCQDPVKIYCSRDGDM